MDFFYVILPDYLADILGSFAYHLPRLVIAVMIILAGIYILTRKKDELENEPLSNNKRSITGRPIAHTSKALLLHLPMNRIFTRRHYYGWYR
ncbi:MAG: hypothetical protein ACLUTA_18250 [Blautia wexlerae]